MNEYDKAWGGTEALKAEKQHIPSEIRRKEEARGAKVADIWRESAECAKQEPLDYAKFLLDFAFTLAGGPVAHGGTAANKLHQVARRLAELEKLAVNKPTYDDLSYWKSRFEDERGRVERQRATIEHLQKQVVELQKRLATIKECACG